MKEWLSRCSLARHYWAVKKFSSRISHNTLTSITINSPNAIDVTQCFNHENYRFRLFSSSFPGGGFQFLYSSREKNQTSVIPKWKQRSKAVRSIIKRKPSHQAICSMFFFSFFLLLIYVREATEFVWKSHTKWHIKRLSSLFFLALWRVSSLTAEMSLRIHFN